MTVAEALALEGLERADAEVLLAKILEVDRTALFAHPERSLTAEEWSRFDDFLARKRGGEPTAYLRGLQEFYGRPFHVDSRVLIPRTATETLVEEALRMIDGGGDGVRAADSEIVVISRRWNELHPKVVVDIGTGSGCIAVTIALERPTIRVIATDKSPDTLEIARENARRLGASVEFREGSDLDPVLDLREPFLLASNPPYIPVGMTLDSSVKDFEPHVALFGGEDGADMIRRLLTAARHHPHCIGYLIECRADQENVFSPAS
jgi:release factor glutamine methyltransferase